jgi:hypothetical protein
MTVPDAIDATATFAPSTDLLAVYAELPGDVGLTDRYDILREQNAAAALTLEIDNEIMTKARDVRAAIWSKC